MIIIMLLIADVVAAGVIVWNLLRFDYELNLEISRLKLQLGMSEASPDQLRKEVERIKEESNKLQTELGQKKQEIITKDNNLGTLVSEVQKLKGELEIKVNEFALKEQEITGLKAQLAGMANLKNSDFQNQQKIATCESQLKKMEEELKNKDNEITRLRSEIERMTLEAKDNAQNMAHLKKFEEQMTHIEKLMDEEKKALHATKLRIQEGRMKIDLLDEKTKGAVESIALFAQGKEFEEFRKSIHMDQMIQKYEDQIKSLQIKNLELEKKP
ncbi:MAG: hypothetical protein HQL13_02415 [Candidatus Omnitrophica bacterium]|nr:hypothetical protein [Candidatus Omnitrophota bacterium]